MFDVFRKYLLAKISLSQQDMQRIESVSIVKKLSKRQYLLQQGDVWRYYAFVCQGCLRSYRVDDKGIDHISKFSLENSWAGDRESLEKETASHSNIDALEDSVVLLFKKDDFDNLRKTMPVFDDLIENLIHRSYAVTQERMHAAIGYTPEEKYRNFIKKYPDIFNRVPLHMIASYLGLSFETLTRIRSQSLKNDRP
jgi:CRP-like cAMP-binding protein